MAQFIIKMDNQHADCEASILAAGATILKQYKIPGMYLIQADSEQVSQIDGIVSSDLSDTNLNISQAAQESTNTYDISHLSRLGHNGSAAAWSPRDQSLGSGVVIYLVDTGVDQSHTEFQNSDIVNLYTAFTDFTDQTGHGTSVASLIVGSNIGVSPGATLVNLKLFDSNNGFVTVSSVLDAFDALIDHHISNDPAKIKVVCLPWTSDKNQTIDQALNELLDLNLLVVAAAGNQGVEVDNFSPGGLDTVITVGAIDLEYCVTSYTNLPFKAAVSEESVEVKNLSINSAKLDVFALGSDVCVASIVDNNSYTQVSGTSFSSALVSGVLAHYIALFPDADTGIIKSYFYVQSFKLATRPVIGISGLQDRSYLLDFNNVNVPDGQVIDHLNVNFAIAYALQTTDVTFVNRPSGRLINIKKGDIASTSISILSNASDISVLEFTPISPWMTLDLVTGDFTADTSDESLAPGIYHFAVKGTIASQVGVAEYSVGVYIDSVDELNSATEYYYDIDTESYEEAEPSDLVAFSSAK